MTIGSAIKKALTFYVSSWWLPAAIAGAIIFATWASFSLMIGNAETPGEWVTAVNLSVKLLWICPLSVAGVAASSIWNFRKRRRAKGAVALATGLLLSYWVLNIWVHLAFTAISGPPRDGFADNLTIPSHIEIESPLGDRFHYPSADEPNKPGDTKQGKPSFALRNGSQGGIYFAELWVNPGEAGTVYLKAFEITQSTPLSAGRLKINSKTRMNWSGDPAQVFFANPEFTIFEGDWEKYYAARFEVWFAPDAGQEQRKLMEKNFKIEGWTR